jgi:universal stress protein A
MLNIQKILCPTDFSEPSYEALDDAVELAKLFQAALTVLYVLPLLPPQPTNPNRSFEIPEYERIVHKESKEHLEELVAQRVPKTVKAVALIGHGSPAKEIVRIAEDEKMDLIVISTHGHSGWQRLVMGSVAEKVVRSAPCPVLAVREFRHP